MMTVRVLAAGLPENWTIRGLFSVLAGLVALSCASPPRQYHFDPVVPVSVDQETAWDRAIELFAANSWPIASIDRASWFIATDWMPMDSDAFGWLDCGSPGASNVLGTSIKLTVVIRPGSVMVTAAGSQERWIGDDPPHVVPCEPTGEAGRWLAELIGAPVVGDSLSVSVARTNLGVSCGVQP